MGCIECGLVILLAVRAGLEVDVDNRGGRRSSVGGRNCCQRRVRPGCCLLGEIEVEIRAVGSTRGAKLSEPLVDGTGLSRRRPQVQVPSLAPSPL